MRILFFSERCEHCKKLLAYLDKNNIKNLFKMVNVDVETVPKYIDMVPTIIDSELNQPLKGKKAFEYLLNIKYFNNPTNNIEYIKDLPPNPDIPIDDKANDSELINLEITKEAKEFYETNKGSSVSATTQKMSNARQVQDKKLAVLLQLKRR
jgi:hypothetical protein